jgi:hypothetical protein
MTAYNLVGKNRKRPKNPYGMAQKQDEAPPQEMVQRKIFSKTALVLA